jgi:hypothetical protein
MLCVMPSAQLVVTSMMALLLRDILFLLLVIATY